MNRMNKTLGETYLPAKALEDTEDGGGRTAREWL
jgi:hypothetical protein